MEILVIANTNFVVLHEDKDRKIIQDVSSFSVSGLNEDVYLLDIDGYYVM